MWKSPISTQLLWPFSPYFSFNTTVFSNFLVAFKIFLDLMLIIGLNLLASKLHFVIYYLNSAPQTAVVLCRWVPEYIICSLYISRPFCCIPVGCYLDFYWIVFHSWLLFQSQMHHLVLILCFLKLICVQFITSGWKNALEIISQLLLGRLLCYRKCRFCSNNGRLKLQAADSSYRRHSLVGDQDQTSPSEPSWDLELQLLAPVFIVPISITIVGGISVWLGEQMPKYTGCTWIFLWVWCTGLVSQRSFQHTWNILRFACL